MGPRGMGLKFEVGSWKFEVGSDGERSRHRDSAQSSQFVFFVLLSQTDSAGFMYERKRLWQLSLRRNLWRVSER